MYIALTNKTATSYTNRDGKIVRVGDMWKLEYSTGAYLAVVVTHIVQGKFDNRWRIVVLRMGDGDSAEHYASKFCKIFNKVA